jgi:hypothetical protein
METWVLETEGWESLDRTKLLLLDLPIVNAADVEERV